MVTKIRTRVKIKGNKYAITSGRKVIFVIAKNFEEAGVKARRLFPKSKLITVTRETPKRKGYETHIISL